MRDHPTKIERAERINLVYRMVLNGYTRRDVILFCADKYGIGERVVDKYLMEVRKILADNAEKTNIDERSKCIQRMEYMYNSFLSDGLKRDAVRCLENLCKIHGLFVDKAEISSKSKITFNLADKSEEDL